MGVLYIYKLDSSKEPISVLENGDHIFGRGPLLKCTDRRVSRNHGVISVSNDTATITSTHQNPCFYQAANSSTITILPRDSPMNINDGDKFALLADNFWFRIKIGVNDAENVSPITHTSEHNSINDERLQNTTTNTNTENNVTNDSMDFLSGPSKRTHEDDLQIADCKRSKHEEGLFSRLENLKSDNEPEEKKKEVLSESEDDVRQTRQSNKEVVSESEEEKEVKVNTKVSKKKPQKKTPQTSGNDDELKAMLFSSDEEGSAGNQAIPDSSTKESNENMNKAEKDGEEVNEKDADKNSNNNAGDGAVGSNADEGGSSNTNGKKARRDRCWYGIQCYRKSASHLAEFSHPGDSDFDSDPNDDRPSCSYGAACYRRNKDHRKNYKHPRDSQKPNKKRAKKAANAGGAAAPALPKKRTARKNYYDESSEDDYDMEDPFLDDGSSEYMGTSSSDESSDSSRSEGAEEDTKRMLKEAKKFTRGRKKKD